MVKILLGGIILFVSTLLGKSLTDKHSLKKKYFEDLKDFNGDLIRNLKFRKDTLFNTLKTYSCQNDFNYTLDSYRAYVYNAGEVEDVFFPQYIDGEDRTFLYSYFEKLGKGNSFSEVEFLTFSQDIINEKLLKIKDNCSKFSKLGQKLGFAVGMTVFILIL